MSLKLCTMPSPGNEVDRWSTAKQPRFQVNMFHRSTLFPNNYIIESIISLKVQTLTIKGCKGPQKNMLKNVGSIKT